ncbi:hypothetical protein [Pseudomonas sp. S3_A09]
MDNKHRAHFSIDSRTLSKFRHVSSIESFSMSKLVESMIDEYLQSYEKVGYRNVGIIAYRVDKFKKGGNEK